jgi:hypothetical protein
VRDGQFQPCQNFGTDLYARVEEGQQMRTIRVLASVDVASAVCELRAYGFQVLRRVEVGFLEMVEQTLNTVSITMDLHCQKNLTLIVDTNA